MSIFKSHTEHDTEHDTRHDTRHDAEPGSTRTDAAPDDQRVDGHADTAAAGDDMPDRGPAHDPAETMPDRRADEHDDARAADPDPQDRSSGTSTLDRLEADSHGGSDTTQPAHDGRDASDNGVTGRDTEAGGAARSEEPHSDTAAEDTTAGDTTAGDTAGDTTAGDTTSGRHTTADSTSAERATAGHGQDEPERLVPRERAEAYSTQWTSVKGDFVDEPREAVRKADALVGELLDELHQLFADQRRRLEEGLDGDSTSTEDLRMALRRYRSFFDRLVSF